MPYDTIISRSEAGALIPPEHVNQVVKVAAQESLALGLMRRVEAGTKLSSVPVLSAAPTAYFVTGGDTAPSRRRRRPGRASTSSPKRSLP